MYSVNIVLKELQRAQNELNMSDKIIEGDLLRFSESNKTKTGEVKTAIKEEKKSAE